MSNSDGKPSVGSKYTAGNQTAIITRVERDSVSYEVDGRETAVSLLEFQELAFKTMLRKDAKFIPAKKKRMTNAERLKRQGAIFNHSGECGKIVTK